MRKNELAETTAVTVWRNGDRARALGMLRECGYNDGAVWQFLTGRLGFGSAVAVSLAARYGA